MEQDHAMENHIMARTKFVFASTFAASTLGYSVAIAYSLSGRAAKMSLIRPRADHVAGTPTNFRGPDRWETGDDPRLRIHLPSVRHRHLLSHCDHRPSLPQASP
ncbi:uncharacterized protein [Oryza sativa Japonica Group]|uniref:uncharacterized protein n=1 Tax=Oryza sativa subsp. japonica TaxID=39947 RepID=UPI00077553B3|nr:uncharacterized protein LOC107277972 isoform X2 [Oryza sativa Japonica Group]